MNFLTINPYTTDASIFADLVPKVPPEIVEVADTGGLLIPSFIENGLLVLLVILLIQAILSTLNIPYSQRVSNLIVKRRRIKTFGKEIGNKDLTILLLEFIVVLSNKYEFDGFTVEPLMKRTRKEAKNLLELLAESEPSRKVAIYDSIDIALTKEKYIITELINYLESTNKPRKDVLDSAFFTIIEGFQSALTSYEDAISTSLENELSLYEDIRKKEIEREKNNTEFLQAMRAKAEQESRGVCTENLSEEQGESKKLRVQRKPNSNYKPEQNSSESALINALTKISGTNMHYCGFDKDNPILDDDSVKYSRISALKDIDNDSIKSTHSKVIENRIGDKHPSLEDGQVMHYKSNIDTKHMCESNQVYEESSVSSSTSSSSSTSDNTSYDSSSSSSNSSDSGSCD